MVVDVLILSCAFSAAFYTFSGGDWHTIAHSRQQSARILEDADNLHHPC
jgi:hypothetical protein